MAEVEDTDRGWAEFQARLKGIEGKAVRVGILSDAPKHPSGVNMADIATFNEFGTATIPARPFLRSAFDGNAFKWERFIAAEVRRITAPTGFRSVNTALNRLGLRMVADVRKRIVDLREPPNAPATIRKKGSSNPLIDTGRMRQSINFEVIDK